MLAHLVGVSGAVAAYVDRKAVPRAELERIAALLEDAGLPLLGETALGGLGVLPWDDYAALLALAAIVAPGAALRVGALASCPDPVPVRLDPALVAEALREDEPGLAGPWQPFPLSDWPRRGGFCPFSSRRLRWRNRSYMI